jgi:Na+-driven multidrug efflux pump
LKPFPNSEPYPGAADQAWESDGWVAIFCAIVCFLFTKQMFNYFTTDMSSVLALSNLAQHFPLLNISFPLLES